MCFIWVDIGMLISNSLSVFNFQQHFIILLYSTYQKHNISMYSFSQFSISNDGIFGGSQSIQSVVIQASSCNDQLLPFNSASDLTTLRNIPLETPPVLTLQSPFSSLHQWTPAAPIPKSKIPVLANTSTNNNNNNAKAAALEVEAPVPIMQNVVSTAGLGVKLDLHKIASQALNTEYNPKRFSAAIMRIRDPRTTALIFNNGKIVCTGAKSLEASRLAARKFGRIIQKLGYPSAKFDDFKVQNVVCSCDCKFKIGLGALNIAHPHFSSYEPELFPGLVYRMVKPKLVFLVFQSGKVVITRGTQKEDIELGFRQIYPILKTFKL